ncbi:MAG: (2Fe-2S)-binding protein [Candidatus Binatia bacterium]
MIICHCAGVTDRAIEQLARDGVRTVKDVVRLTGAGRCCAPCRTEIAAILSQQHASAAAQ